MRLPHDAPVIAVPMCVKKLDGQNFHTVGEKYLTALAECALAYPLSFPALGELLPADALLDRVDGLLFTGSPSNIATHHYAGGPDRPESPQDPGRDAITLPLIRAAIARNVPLLCICRGVQELNVALGGSLHTLLHEVPGHGDHRGPTPGSPLDILYQPAHKVTFTPGGRFAEILGKSETVINSVHWQGIDRLAERLAVEGRAPDGVIEAVSVRGASFALGTQWHPEYRAAANPDSAKLFAAFGEAARAYSRTRRVGKNAA